jgi:hypothetical protein
VVVASAAEEPFGGAVAAPADEEAGACLALMAATRSPLRIAEMPLMPMEVAMALRSVSTIADRPLPLERRVRLPAAFAPVVVVFSNSSVVSLTKFLPCPAARGDPVRCADSRPAETSACDRRGWENPRD